MVDLSKIGQTIERLRKSKQMTQDDLASALYVTRQAISKWETGKGIPSIEVFIELTRLFNVSIDALIDGVELSKHDYLSQLNQLPRAAVFANFIQSNTLTNDFEQYFYLFHKEERKQFLDLLIKGVIDLPYKTVWPHLSEEERIYLFGYILSHKEEKLDELYPHLTNLEEQMLYKKHPAQVKFVLVDPKKVELTLFNKIERHFLAKLPGEDEPIITDTSKVPNTLNSLCIEMDNRYELLKDAQVRNIKEYNEKFIKRKLNPERGHLYLPYIVVLIDEFADLIMTAGKEVEHPIARLAQLARAIGIHLIVATQRPSVNVITGMIKANFPQRIAFRVLSKIDSRTILDASGADQLIGKGDMLISTGNDMIRLQCGFVDTPEVEEICNFIGNQRAYPDAYLLPEYIDDNVGSDQGAGDLDDLDANFVEAARIVVIHQQGSASLLQRKLKLGYNRAGRIVDQLEAHGIIGPFKGSKAREVLFSDEISLEQYLKSKDLL